MTSAPDLSTLDADELRQLASRLMEEMRGKQALIAKLTHEMAILKRLKFAASSEAYSGEQQRMLFEILDTDIEALTAEIEYLAPTKPAEDDVRSSPRAHHCRPRCHARKYATIRIPPRALAAASCSASAKTWRSSSTTSPASLRWNATSAANGSAGNAKRWCRRRCRRRSSTRAFRRQACWPMYRWPNIRIICRYTGRAASLAVPDSPSRIRPWFSGSACAVCGVQLQPLVDALQQEVLVQPVLHADETPVAMLKPGNGKTHRAYLWSYCSTSMSTMKAVVFDFAESRAGRHAGDILGHWRGTLICEDYVAYKALFRQGMREAGCMAHARRKFHELYANHQSQIAEEALKLFGMLYDVERQVQGLDIDARRATRQQFGR